MLGCRFVDPTVIGLAELAAHHDFSVTWERKLRASSYIARAHTPRLIHKILNSGQLRLRLGTLTATV